MYRKIFFFFNHKKDGYYSFGQRWDSWTWRAASGGTLWEWEGMGLFTRWEDQLLNPGPQWREVILERTSSYSVCQKWYAVCFGTRNCNYFSVCGMHLIFMPKWFIVNSWLNLRFGIRNWKKGMYLIVIYIAFEIYAITYYSICNFLIMFLDELTNYLMVGW